MKQQLIFWKEILSFKPRKQPVPADRAARCARSENRVRPKKFLVNKFTKYITAPRRPRRAVRSFGAFPRPRNVSVSAMIIASWFIEVSMESSSLLPTEGCPVKVRASGVPVTGFQFITNHLPECRLGGRRPSWGKFSHSFPSYHHWGAQE